MYVYIYAVLTTITIAISLIAVRETGVPSQCPILGHTLRSIYSIEEFQGDSQLVPHDAERR